MTRSNIAGDPGIQGPAALADSSENRMKYFHVLSRNEQADSGMTIYGVSHATGLAVEQVQRLLQERAR